MTDADIGQLLDQLERLEKEATAAPWELVPFGGTPTPAGVRCIARPRPDLAKDFPPKIYGPAFREESVFHCGFGVKESDCRFVAALRNAFPAIVAHVRRLEAERDQLKADLDLWRPLTHEEAEAAYEAAEAAPMSDEQIRRMVKRALDPAELLPNSEQAQLAVALQRAEAERDAAVVERERLRQIVEHIGNHEALAKRFREQSHAGESVEGTRESLAQCARMLDQYAPECFPANEKGQVHFARAMMESVADEIKKFLEKGL